MSAPGLRRLQADVPRRIRDLDERQQRLMSVSLTGTGVNAGKEIAEGGAPNGDGPGRCVPLDDRLAFFDLVADIQPLESEPPRAGFLQVRDDRCVSSVPGQLGQLVGGDPVMLLGNATGCGLGRICPRVVPPPPVADRARGVHEYPTPPASERLAASAPIAGTPWAVWVDYPLDAIVAPAGEFVTRMALVSLVIVFALAGMVALVTARLARPLQTLTAAAAQIAGGNWSHRVPVSRRDEVGKLSFAFNQMATEIQTVNRTLTDANDRTEFALGAAQHGHRRSRHRGQHDHLAACARCGARTAAGGCAEDDRGFSRAHAPGRSGERARDGRPRPGQSPRRSVGDVPFHPPRRVCAVARRAGPGSSSIRKAVPLRALGVIIDITRRMALEEQLRQAQKLEGVGQLAGGVAHDFNNLLTVILGFCRTAAARAAAERSPARRRRSEIMQAGKRGAGLTRQLLAFSRRQVLEPTRRRSQRAHRRDRAACCGA